MPDKLLKRKTIALGKLRLGAGIYPRGGERFIVCESENRTRAVRLMKIELGFLNFCGYWDS